MRNMKRLLLVILLFMIIPVYVLADGGGPSIIGYEAVIINKKGAKDIYGDGTTIPYNTKVYVDNEYDEGAHACYKDVCAYVSFKDIAPLKEEVLPKDLEKKENDGASIEEYVRNFLVVNKNGIKLKKGPSDAYGEYNVVIPYNTVIESTYGISGYMDYYSWFYIDNENTKGWIGDGIAAYYNESIMIFDDLKFYDINTDKEITVIPKETIIKEYYADYNNVYFTYNNTFGYIKETKKDEDDYGYFSYGHSCEGTNYLLIMKSIEIESKGKAISSIPKGEIIEALYCPYDESRLGEYYVSYNGLKGFVKNDDTVVLYEDEKGKEMNTTKELELYDYDVHYHEKMYNENFDVDAFFEEHKTSVKIPANSKITYYKSSNMGNSRKNYKINLVQYNKNIGWLIDNVEEGDFSTPTPLTSPTVNPSRKPNDKPKDAKPSDIILYGIIAGGILTATAVVTILLINNKKSKKKDLSNKVVDKSKNEIQDNNKQDNAKKTSAEEEKK